MGRQISGWVLVGAVALASNAAATANSPSVALHNARLALERYETEPTLTAIGDLGMLTPAEIPSADRNEAMFLRSVAAADLLIIATFRGDAELRAAIAQAVGTSEENAATDLKRDLTAIGRGVYATAALDAAKAMNLLAKSTPITGGDLAGWTSVRRDLLLVRLIRQSLDSGQDALGSLETLGTDPCAAPAKKCEEPFAFFDARGRKAVATLTEFSRAMGRIEKAAADGDPLSRALTEDLTRQLEALAGLAIRPTPTIDQAWQLVEVTGPAAGSATPDLMIAVSATEARFGFVPRVRLTAEGTVEVFAAGTPMLMQPAHVAFPSSFAPSVRPINELTEALQGALQESGGLSAAIGAAPDAPAHLISRVIHSIRAAGARASWLLARAADGTAVGIPLEVLTPKDATEPATIALRIRLGGYNLRVGHRESEIPRVKLEDGWHFDPTSLDAAIADTSFSSAEVSFMGELTCDHLIIAAFRVAPRNGALRLAIP